MGLFYKVPVQYIPLAQIGCSISYFKFEGGSSNWESFNQYSSLHFDITPFSNYIEANCNTANNLWQLEI